MWRSVWLVIILLVVTACGDMGNNGDSVEQSVSATLTAIADASGDTSEEEENTDSESEETTTDSESESEEENTNSESEETTTSESEEETGESESTVWNAIEGYQDIGVPLPKEDRLFGGGIYVPDGTAQDLQTALFTDVMVLGVGTYYPNAYDGSDPIVLPDGTDIAGVEFFLFDPNGADIYQNNDTDIPYCLFGDDGDSCTLFPYFDNGCQWWNGTPIVEGFYSLNVTIRATDGTESVWFATLDVRFSDDSPCATPREILSQTFTIDGCCNDGSQRNDDILSAYVDIETAGYLATELILGEGACSDVAFHLFVDGNFITTTSFVGPLSEQGFLTEYVELGEYDPGFHTLQISPEGREGGCNEGALGNWEGSVNLFYSQ